MQLFLTGGFLGSGKTTAIQQAMPYLQQLNKKAGVVTNDQGEKQVDTGFIKTNGIPAEEVANSCFCCNYPALEKGMQALEEKSQVEIIFAESVGSCTDLAATIINPLLQFSPGRYDIVLSVFADVRLLVLFLKNDKRLFFDDVNYIYQKQLEEADIIIVNKIDLIAKNQLDAAKLLIAAAYPGKKILYQNSLSEDSIKVWVDTLLARVDNTALRPALIIDYDMYGAGEAELAWLDEELAIATKDDRAVEACYTLMQLIYDKINAAGYPVGHVKFLLDTGLQQHKISFTSMYGSIQQQENLPTAKRVNLLINARVQVLPNILQQLVADAIMETANTAGCTITQISLSCFKPGYPRPTHRVTGVAV